MKSLKSITKKDYHPGNKHKVYQIINSGSRILTYLKFSFPIISKVKRIKIIDDDIYEDIFEGPNQLGITKLSFFLIFHYERNLFGMSGRGLISDRIDQGTSFIISTEYIMEHIASCSDFPTIGLIKQYIIRNKEYDLSGDGTEKLLISYMC